MKLVLTEDQEMIASTAIEFMNEKSQVSRFRALRDGGDEAGFSPSLWKEMAELGWVGMIFPEAHGGADMGLADLLTVLEAAGRNLAPEPFLSNVLLAGRTLMLAGTEKQQAEWLPRIGEGSAFLSLASQEADSRYDVHRVGATAVREGGGFRLDGEKIQVLDGGVADALIVSARTAGSGADVGGISLFLVPGDAQGLERTRQHRLDERGCALVKLAGVQVPESALIGAEGEAGAVLEDVIDGATVGLCAEMLGGMNRAFELSLDHLKQREQFGQVIGSFQALKHRAARVYIELELSRSVVMAAARALDGGDSKARELVSLAKARCSDAYVLVTDEAVQFFAGVGMTDEYDIGFYMKRARAAELSFGDAAFHRDRWARLRGY